MRKLYLLLWLFLGVIISFGLFNGCDNDTPSTDETCPPQWLNSITMYVPEDTLWIPPGDSASTNLAVIVADGNGNVLEGVRVNLSLSNPQLGFVEFLDTDLRDTTNAQGRVEMRYTAVGLSGEVVFSATAGNVGARDTIVCIAIGTVSVGAINITIEADTLLFTQHASASASVSIEVRDTDGNPLPGTRIAFYNETPQLGYFEFLNSALRDTTDAEGLVELLFTSLGPSGDEIFTVTVGSITVKDTLTCRMLPDVITVSIYNEQYSWQDEQLLFSYDFDAVYTDGFGVPFAGVQLEALPTLGELVEVLPLTDANGRTTGSVAGIYDNHSGLCVMVSDGIVLGEDCMHGN